MEVLSVTLKNFKAHRDRYYEFRPGANAICGENGSGKTSILEAIAWVLFDHSEYKRAELISVGAKSAQVSVSFVSHLDGRVYDVRRCTSRGYEVHDPQLKRKLELKKLDDVRCWLCEHLGVGVHTELAKLFAETIGIPQGTFTVDFLKSAGDRKKVFDPILKVEEYKQAYDQAQKLTSYAQAQVQQLEHQLHSYEQQLEGWEDLKQQQKTLAQTILQQQSQLKALSEQMAEHQTELKALKQQDQAIQVLDKQVQHLQTQWTSKQEILQLLESNWQQAEQAVQICRQHRPQFQAYQQAQETLKTLAQQQKQRQHLLQERDRIQNTLRDQQVAMSQHQGQLTTFAKMEAELQDWQTKVPQQQQLEQEKITCQQALQTLTTEQHQLARLQEQLQQQQQQRDALEETISQLAALEPQVAAIPSLEAQQQNMQERLGRITAAQQFATELQDVIAAAEPQQQQYQQQVGKAKALLQSLSLTKTQTTQLTKVLDQGAALTTQMIQQLQTAFADIIDPQAVTKLNQQLQQIKTQLKAAQKAQTQWLMLDAKQQQLAELNQAIASLQQECDRIQVILNQEPQLQSQLTHLDTQLTALNDPKGHVRILQQQLQGATQLEAEINRLQQACQRHEQSLATIEAQVEALGDLAAQVEAQQLIQQEHQDVYQLYLRHRNQANAFKELDQQRRSAIAAQTQLQAQLTEAQAQWQEKLTVHNPERLAELSQTYEHLQRQQAQLQGGLAPQQAQLQYLDQQLQAKQALAQERDQVLVALADKHQISQFITDARNIYKQSGPRITKFYLTEISWEADRLYRELLDRPDVALQWTEDYEIQVQEQGHWRSFKSLSGGEQMCAALAVRLALLKVLVDINIAFFDEPTTNMDELRRRQLAEALGHLKSFHQLFVISHDDTFESVTENIIRVERVR
ncbi:SMC family ATPase [Acaryochloris sp. IP29b_bin.137]|uniref:AAA family ATPase n=1 Tax=Acaryochloris sp. IP29b_bin.137 TaxID=2969217 RepID=UPI002627E574|nr:SMC family ATPase [Acaryochloris sp. IP29b_bin.137]